MDNKINVHKEINLMIVSIRKALTSAVKEYDTAVVRAETAKYALGTAKAALSVNSIRRKRGHWRWKTHQFYDSKENQNLAGRWETK